MAEITAKDVAALRKVSGAGMMDCKRALEENGGDIESAGRWLREQGLVKAAKREGRAASTGVVDVAYEGGRGALVELTSETDFVAKGDDLTGLASELVASVLDEGADGLGERAFRGDTVEGVVKGLAAKLGENVGLGRVERLETGTGLVDGYKHVQADRGVIGVLVQLEGVDPADARAREVAHEIALHIASAAPRFLRREDVPVEALDAERQIYETLTRNEGKPEQAIPKIVEGRLSGFYRDVVLLEQASVRDPKVTIASLVAGLGGQARVEAFRRVKVGEE